MWFEGNIHQGEWPQGLEDMEPGFVPFFYHVVRKLEQRDFVVSEEAIIDAFATIVRDEFSGMMAKRQQAMFNRYTATKGQNPWFGDGSRAPAAEAVPRLTGDGQRRQGIAWEHSQVNSQTFVAPPASPVETPAHVLVWRQRARLAEMRNTINEERYSSNEDEDNDVDMVPMPPFSPSPLAFIMPLTAESEEEQDDGVSLR
jgi:hypothetical protein